MLGEQKLNLSSLDSANRRKAVETVIAQFAHAEEAGANTVAVIEDAKRGARARQVVKEVIDAGKLKPVEDQVLLPAMDALVKKWGPAPATKKDD